MVSKNRTRKVFFENIQNEELAQEFFEETFPEFCAFRPQGRLYGQYWFRYHSDRIEVLDEIIKQLEYENSNNAKIAD